MWFLRHARLADVWMYVRHARIDLLLVAFGCIAATYWIRVVRWQYLLAPVGKTRFRTAFRTTVIGFAALGVLPARAGDVLRPYLLARQEGLNASAVFATIVMERVLDLFAMLALLALYVFGFADSSRLPSPLRHTIEISTAIAGLAGVALMAIMWVLASHPERTGTVVHTMTRVVHGKLAMHLSQLAIAFSSGLAVARRPRELLLGVLWSFPLWVVMATEAWAVTAALGIDMPYAGTFLLQGLLVIGVAIPTPGGIGSYHEAYRIGVTTFFGAPNDRAVAAGIVVHAISFIPIVLLGMLFMAQDGLSVGGLRAIARSAREKETAHTDEMPVLHSSRR